jgi:hypothetical protein
MQYLEVLAGGLLAIAGGVFIHKANRLLSLYENATSWSKVPGVVGRSELLASTDGDGTSYRALLTCSYSVGNFRYTTSRHTEGMTFAQPERSARALVSDLPVGKPVQVSVDPSDAGAGVLITGKPEDMIVSRRIGHACVIAGVLLVG